MDPCCTFHGNTVTAERTLQGLDASDELVSKAAKVKPVAQIARIERKLRDLLFKKWNQRALQAEKTATTLFRQGKNADQITAAVGKIMNKWADDIARRFLTDIKSVYEIARKAGFDKAAGRIKGSLQYDTTNFSDEKGIDVEKAKSVPAGVGASFDLVDEKAIEALQEDQLFWIGEHYDKNVSEAIREVTRETIAETGVSRSAAAKTMAQRVKDTLAHVRAPKGFHGSQAQYMEGLVANAMTNARAQGQLRSFNELEVAKYEIVNPSDSRTCPVCSHMNGKVFTVEQGTRQMDRDMKAKKPEDIKRTHPWLTPKKLKSISPKPGNVSTKDSAGLAKAGLALPPYHFRCRCTVDMA